MPAMLFISDSTIKILHLYSETVEPKVTKSKTLNFY